MLLQSSLDQRIHFDVIQVLLLILIYYGIVIRHIAIRLVAHLALLACFNLCLQILRQSINHLLLVLINEQGLLWVPGIVLLLFIKVADFEVHVSNRYIISLDNGRVRSA